MKPAKTKRSLQFIIPLSIILLLFCSGIYLGATKRETVLAFEKNYLDMDHLDSAGVHHPLEDLLEPAKATVLSNPLLSSVPTANAATIPHLPSRSVAAGVGAAPQYRQPSQTALSANSARPDLPHNSFDPRNLGRQPSPAAEMTPPTARANPAPIATETLPSNRPLPPQPNIDANPEPADGQAQNAGTTSPQSDSEQPGTIAGAAPPKVSNLRDLYDLPVTIRIKVLTDEDFVSHNEDWMAKIQTVIAEVSRVYRNNFGIEIQLVGLGQWPLTTTGRTERQLYTDLTTRSTESADVLLGFVNRELDPRAYAWSNSAQSAANNRFSLVGRSKGSHHSPFLKGTLRSLGHLLGAREIDNVDSEEFQLGSWMSSKPLPSRQAPWIGAENRRRILRNKTRPFSAGADKGEQL